MNPIKNIKNSKLEIIENLRQDNALSETQALMVYESIVDFISRLTGVRKQKFETKKVLSDLDKHDFSIYIKHWLYKAISSDDNYSIAYNIVTQDYNRENYTFPLSLKNVEDFENNSSDTKSFRPKVNEDYADDLFMKLKNYFQPEELFLNFLNGLEITDKIDFSGDQNLLAGIFITCKEFKYANFGTHDETYNFIKDTFLVKGKPIESKQILSYLKEPGKVDKYGSVIIKGKVNRDKWIDLSI